MAHASTDTLAASRIGFTAYDVKRKVWFFFGHNRVAVASPTNGHVVSYPARKRS